MRSRADAASISFAISFVLEHQQSVQIRLFPDSLSEPVKVCLYSLLGATVGAGVERASVWLARIVEQEVRGEESKPAPLQRVTQRSAFNPTLAIDFTQLRDAETRGVLHPEMRDYKVT